MKSFEVNTIFFSTYIELKIMKLFDIHRFDVEFFKAIEIQSENLR